MEFGIQTGKVFPFIKDPVIDPWFVMQYVMVFLVLHNQCDREERAGCSSIIVLLMNCDC